MLRRLCIRRSMPAAAVRFFSEAQRQQWDRYLATGRGSAALFGTIDKDADGKLSKEDVKTFLQTVQDSKVVEKALKLLERRADDHSLVLDEFQHWLVSATQDVVDACIQPHYESHPATGPRSELIKVDDHAWNKSTMNQAIRRMQYAVRGELVMKAEQLAAAGRNIIYTNIGNPHAVGQTPVTYYRQVLALCDLPAQVGVDNPNVSQLFPGDVIERARELRGLIGSGGTGSYTHSQGISGVRKHVADFIEARDGHPAYAGDIFLTNGASSAIEFILEGLIGSDHDAIMIPIPQYPIYSALITRLGGHKIGYYLDEKKGWGVSRAELHNRLDEAKRRDLTVKGLALINPGNPTGQVMSKRDLGILCRFCSDNDIVLLADEVYQRNIYEGEFTSAKKVALETPGCSNLELVSFHSTSKGLIGECGKRGGYMELHNIDKYVQSQLYKLASSGLCSGTAGQIMTSLMVRGPEQGDESYEQFVHEEQAIYDGLKKRSKALVEGLNSIDGIECQPAQGAMYAFPKVDLPEKAILAAESKDPPQTPDTMYALSLLDEADICVVPASGFGQKEGRIGFRTTFLPPDDQLFHAIEEFGRHHKLFVEKYQ